MTTFSPALISWPARLVSRVAVLRNWITGGEKRSISSIAAGSSVMSDSSRSR